MANVKDLDRAKLTLDAKENSIDVWLVAMLQIPKKFVLWCGGVAIWQIAKAEDCILETEIPLARDKRLRRIDFRIE